MFSFAVSSARSERLWATGCNRQRGSERKTSSVQMMSWEEIYEAFLIPLHHQYHALGPYLYQKIQTESGESCQRHRRQRMRHCTVYILARASSLKRVGRRFAKSCEEELLATLSIFQILVDTQLTFPIIKLKGNTFALTFYDFVSCLLPVN